MTQPNGPCCKNVNQDTHKCQTRRDQRPPDNTTRREQRLSNNMTRRDQLSPDNMTRRKQRPLSDCLSWRNTAAALVLTSLMIQGSMAMTTGTVTETSRIPNTTLPTTTPTPTTTMTTTPMTTTPTTTTPTTTPTTTVTTTMTTTTTTEATTTSTPEPTTTELQDGGGSSSSSSSNVGAIVGGVIAAVVVVGLVTAVLFFLAKRRQWVFFKPHQDQNNSTTTSQSNPHKTLPPKLPEAEKPKANGDLEAAEDVNDDAARVEGGSPYLELTRDDIHTEPSYAVSCAQALVTPQEQRQQSQRRSVFDEASARELDPIYTNLPQYDVPPHDFHRKQSFPGDLLSTERALELELQKREQENQSAYMSMDRCSNKKNIITYETPLPRNANTEEEPTAEVTTSSTNNMYDRPKDPRVGPMTGTGVYVGPDNLYDTPKPSQASYANHEEIAKQSTKQGWKLKKPSLKRKPWQKSSKKKQKLYNAGIRRMSQKEIYPGDIELPPEYTNFQKRQVPFNDPDIYANV